MSAVLAMTIRCKPDILIQVLPIIKADPKYQGQETFPFVVWVVAQVFFFRIS